MNTKKIKTLSNLKYDRKVIRNDTGENICR